MRLIMFVGICVSVAFGRPQAPADTPASSAPKANVTIIKNERTPNDGKGNYNYDIELSDGTKLIQMGATMPPPAGGNDTEPILVVKGSYSYLDPTGKKVEIKYIADDKGFQATGDSIPTSPPNPNAAGAPVPPAPVVAAAAAIPPPAPAQPVAKAAESEPPLETQASSIASAPSAIV